VPAPAATAAVPRPAVPSPVPPALAPAARLQAPISQASPPGAHWWEHAVERDPAYTYGEILPFRKPLAGGSAEWSPEYSGLVKAVADLFTGPGRAIRGEEISKEEGVSDAMMLLMGHRPPARLLPGLDPPPKAAEPAAEARVEPTMTPPADLVAPEVEVTSKAMTPAEEAAYDAANSELNAEPTGETSLPVAQQAKLPRELAGAKPRYSYGSNQFELKFESDIDRAAYITAQKTRSKRDADYLKFVMQKTGMSESQVRAHGAAVRASIKAQAVDAISSDSAETMLNIKDTSAGAEPSLGKKPAALNKPEQGREPKLGADKPKAAVSKGIDYNQDTLLTAIKKLGGLNVSHAYDIIGEKGFRASSGQSGLWKKNGKSIDYMTQILADEGYIPAAAQGEVDGGVQWLRDAVRDGAEGRNTYSARGDEDVIYGRMRDEAGEIYLGSGPFVPPGAIKRTMTKLFGEPGDNMKAFDPLIKEEQTNIARADRMAARLGSRVRTILPDKADREAVTLAIVRGDLQTLTPQQKTAAQFLQRVYKQVGEYAVEQEAVGGLRKNYQPQRWDTSDPQTLSILNEWKKAKAQGGTVDPASKLGKLLEQKGFGTTAKSPFLMERVISDVFEGMQLGLKPSSLDSAALLETYIPSVARTIYRKKTVEGLANLTADDGNLMLLPYDQKGLPSNYVRIESPETEGMRVHPDIAPAVRVLLETKDPGLFARAAQTISYIGKRAATMYSGFHMGSLYTSWVGNGGNPFTPRQAVKSALDAYRKGGQGDVIDKLLAGGLKLGAPLEDVMARDRAGNVGRAVESTVDRVLPAFAKGKAGDFDRWLQQATFDRVQTGFKIDMAMKEYERAMTKNLTRRKPLTEDQIIEQVGKSVNNMQGGQNWERALTSIESPFMRNVMSRIYSPSGRRVMQTAVFAPDWLKSTLQSWTDAVAPGEPEAVRRGISQRYLARSLAYNQVLGNAMQLSIDGTLMIDHEPKDGSSDWTKQFIAKNTVRFKNGQELDLSKHFMEMPHALSDPKKFAVNKLGVLPRESLSQVENKKWPVWPDAEHMTPTNPPNITTPGQPWLEKRARELGHVAGMFAPIPAQQIIQGHPSAALAGMAGASVRGMADDEKQGRVERKVEERKLKREQREAR
jgi:hypothetical protein